MDYRQVRIISGKGTQPEQFAETLRGVTLDDAGRVYAVGDRQIKVFDNAGTLKARWPTEQPGYCVAVDVDAVTFVGQAGQVERLDRRGAQLDVWRDVGRMGLVTSIGFTGDYVLIADAQDRCIRRYDKSGKWINDIGRDNNTKGFLIPNGHLDFAVDAKGTIHVCNPAKFRVERYAPTGEMLGKFGKFGTHKPEDFPGCCNPTNIALTPEGHVVVTEKAGPRMKVYDASGAMLAIVPADAFDATCKNMDVAVDAKGLIYVVDTARLHICVFEPVDAPMPAVGAEAKTGATP